MELFLFTNFFPNKGGEPFLLKEFEFAKERFKKIRIFPLYENTGQKVIASSGNVNFYASPLRNPKNRGQIFLKGVFNQAPLGFHVREMFSKVIFLWPKKVYWLSVSFCVARAVMASKAYRQMLAEIESSNQPVLYFYWGDNFCWIIPYLRQTLKNKNTKIVVRLHGSDLYENLKGNYAPLRAQIFANSDLLVPISEHGYKFLNQRYAAFKQKFVVSRLGVADHGLNRSSLAHPYHVVSVSNIVPLKRVDKIFEILQKTKSDVVWHHFGSGPLEDDLKARVKNCRKGLTIRLHGQTANSDLNVFYTLQPVNLFINCSASEGLPVSIMEALSFGIPIMATNVGGTSELVSPTNGQLIEQNFSVDTAALIIDKLLNLNENDTKTMRENARKTFEEKVMATKNYFDFYNKINELFPGHRV